VDVSPRANAFPFVARVSFRASAKLERAGASPRATRGTRAACAEIVAVTRAAPTGPDVFPIGCESVRAAPSDTGASAVRIVVWRFKRTST
jgi:hypothetical protein